MNFDRNREKKEICIASYLNINIDDDQITYSISFTNNFDMKSSASLDKVENASSTKSYFPIVTFAIVVIFVDPLSGDKRDSLRTEFSYIPFIANQFHKSTMVQLFLERSALYFLHNFSQHIVYLSKD